MSGETFIDLLLPVLPAIRGFVRARMRNSDYTDDVVQQTLMHAFAHRDQLRANSKFKTWITSIAINEIRGLARRTRACLPLDAMPPAADPDSTVCPHRTYERKERAERLYAGIARLTDRDRDAIRLVDLAEAKLTDAADSLSISLPALKSMHFRARRRLGATVRSSLVAPRPVSQPWIQGRGD